MAPVSSVLLLTTTMMRSGRTLCADSECRVSPRAFPSSRAGMITATPVMLLADVDAVELATARTGQDGEPDHEKREPCQERSQGRDTTSDGGGPSGDRSEE